MMFKDFKYNIGDKVIYKDVEYTVELRAGIDSGNGKPEHVYEIRNKSDVWEVEEYELSPAFDLACQEEEKRIVGREYAVYHNGEWHIAVWEGNVFHVTSNWNFNDRWLTEWLDMEVLLPLE